MVLPPFQGPDESFHFAQAQQWEARFKTPFSDEPYSSELCLNALKNLLEEHRVAALRFNPLATYAGPLDDQRHFYEYLYDNHGCETLTRMALYHIPAGLLLMLIPDGSIVEFYALRLFSVGLLCLGFWGAYRLGKTLFPASIESKTFLLLWALAPFPLLINTLVNYDGLTNTLFLLGFGWAAHLFHSPKALSRAEAGVGLGLVTLAFFAKSTGIFLLFFSLIALVFSKKISGKKFGLFLLMAAPLGLMALWLVFDFPLPSFDGIEWGDRSFLEIFSSLFLARWALLIHSAWGGHGIAQMPFELIALAMILFFIGIGGAVIQVVRERHVRTAEAALLRYALLLPLFFEAVAAFYNLPYLLRSVELFGYVHGRYYFVLLGPLLYLFMRGWKSLLRREWHPFFLKTCIGLLLALHLYFLMGEVIPRYYF